MCIRGILAFAIASTPFLPISVRGQGDTLAIEIASARAMLTHQRAKGALGLAPEMAGALQAPGVASHLRDPARTAQLARAIGAVIRPYSEVTTCGSGKRCPLQGVAAHLALSAPSIANDTATVTSTITQNSGFTRQPREYETILLTLVRRSSGWAVVKEVQLGIS